MRKALTVALCVLAGFAGMFAYRVSEGLYQDWLFLRMARVQAIQAQQRQSVPNAAQAAEEKK